MDTPLATNLIGLFNQPQKVYIDIAAWKTLPHREMVSGLSETIKHACLGSLDMFEFIEEHLDDIFSFQKFACEYIAENNCKIKYNIVMKDERESGLREVLNLGHTVGRAIETVSDYQLLHGEALGIGMAAEVMLSARLGYMSEEEAERVIALYDRAGLPTHIPDYIDRRRLCANSIPIRKYVMENFVLYYRRESVMWWNSHRACLPNQSKRVWPEKSLWNFKNAYRNAYTITSGC